MELAEVHLNNLPTGRGSWDKIRNWILSRQNIHQIELSNEAVNKLIELIGNNYRYIDNELIS